jgi:peptidoglycan hydrolase-like protein with peptidoglycan-binding domain
LIAYATQPGRLAYDGKSQHSPFTASLLRHLEEPDLEIRLMLGRVREDVVAHTDGAQIPWVEEAVLGEFYFSEQNNTQTLAAGKGKADDITFWRSIWRSSSAADYEAYLTQYPKGTFAALAENRLKMLKASVRVAAVTALDDVDARDSEQWQSIQNSLYWLGYYNGKPNGVADAAVMNAIQAFQSGAKEKPTGRLTATQIGRLHHAAATSLVKLGERLSDRVVFDRVRLRSIDRGINEIAQPAYEQLAAKLQGDASNRDVLEQAKRQLVSMRLQRDAVKRQYDRATNDYVVVVAAAGTGYADQLRQADFANMRVSDVTTTRVEALAPRRQTFLTHALEYAEKGRLNEKRWLDELR